MEHCFCDGDDFVEGQVYAAVSGSDFDDCDFDNNYDKDDVASMKVWEGKCIRIIDAHLRQSKMYIAKGNDDMALHSLSVAIPYTYKKQNLTFSQVKSKIRSRKGNTGSGEEERTQEIEGIVYYKLCTKRCRIFLIRAEIKYRQGDLLSADKEISEIIELGSFLESAGVQNTENLLPALLLRANIFVILGVDKNALDAVLEIINQIEVNSDGDGGDDDDDEQRDYFDSLLTNTCYLSTRPVLCASEWHRLRRDFIIDRYPITTSLYENPHARTSQHSKGNDISPQKRFGHYFENLQVFWDRHFGVGFSLCVLLSLLVFIQIFLALAMASAKSYFILFVTSSTIGAFISYGFQAINHDLSHIHRHPTLVWLCMLLSSSMCNFPWALYYKLYHAKHHTFTGGSKDRDGDILFQPWHSPPCIRIKISFPNILNSEIKLTRWYQYFENAPNEGVLLRGNEDDDCSEDLSTRYPCSEGSVSLMNENHSAVPEELLDSTESDMETRVNSKLPTSARKTDANHISCVKYHSSFCLDIDFASNTFFRWLWSIMFSWGIYLVFHIRKYQFDAPHRPMLRYEGLWLCTMLAFGYYGGLFSLLYLWWSCAFSLGACGHPYLGFWLIQHASTRRPLNSKLSQKLTNLAESFEWPKDLMLMNDASQPTISYAGSTIWNLMNFGELWHVEHHDFPMIPAVRYSMLRQIATEYYQDLVTCRSIMNSIREWLFWEDEEWMYKYGDFAAKEEYLSSFYESTDYDPPLKSK